MAGAIRAETSWRLLLRDLGLSESGVLRRAGLPADLLSRAHATLTSAGCFRLLDALEVESGIPDCPLVMGQAFSVESFSPALFAGLCSADLNPAARRFRRTKRLLGPFRLDVEVGDETRLRFGCLDAVPPASIGTTERVFLVHFVRLATRSRLQPASVVLPHALDRPAPCRDFFGVEVQRGDSYTLSFSALEGRRPFLTSNDEMWAFFEPELRRRLFALKERTPVSDRVPAALVELLPSGRPALGEVARQLGGSPRTLQRRLRGEQVRYQAVLQQTRERLARRYLRSSSRSVPRSRSCSATTTRTRSSAPSTSGPARRRSACGRSARLRLVESETCLGPGRLRGCRMRSLPARPLPVFLTSMALVGVALYLVGVAADHWWLRVLTKPLPMVALILWAGSRWGEGLAARALAVGLVLGLGGDMLLELSDATFLPGLVSFLLGHVAYIVAFSAAGRRWAPLQALPLAAFVGAAAALLVPKLGPMGPPVVVYMLAISAMAWRAAALAEARGGVAWLALVGAVLFVFSDTLIALDRFVEPIASVRPAIILT